jgi:hypothetical protein
MPITDWDWEQVENEERVSGTTWGQYHVVGTYGGASFTLVEVGPPQPPPEPVDSIEIPCPEPEGGWGADDPTRTTDQHMQESVALASGQSDFAGVWVKLIREPPGEDPYGPNDIVLNAAFTGEIERHRQELAAVWGGPLCVTRYERTESELRRIQNELTAHAGDLFGVEVLFSSADVVHNRVELGVVAVDEETRAAVDDRYGEGTVLLLPALQPVP